MQCRLRIVFQFGLSLMLAWYISVVKGNAGVLIEKYRCHFYYQSQARRAACQFSLIRFAGGLKTQALARVAGRYGERWRWRQYHGSEPVTTD